tara:strand:+ start:907 stop:1791 length:885 start_codon:yes stop_codon:yes gene_type:complete
MAIIGQLFVNGLIAGSIYALVASGFSLIYATNRFMHFAHGATVAIGGYLLFALFNLLGLPFFLAALGTIVLTALFGLGMNRLIYIPLQRRKGSNIVLLIASLALLTLFNNVIMIAFGPGVKSIGWLETKTGMSIGGAIITPLQIWIVAISVVLMILLHLFMKKTKLGRDMRAVANNKELASIAGINPIKISDYSFMIGSAIAGIAGILIGLEQNLFPTMSTMLIIKGFTGAVVGGITSVPGAVVGSYVVGVVENIGILWLPSGYKDAISFGLLFAFLLWKPTGIFGLNKGVKDA